MKVIKPIVFQDAMLVSSTAVEVYAAYAAGTTYALGDRVDYGSNIYESLQDTNVGHTPDVSPTWWLLVGPDNTHAMFDSQVSTQTTQATPLDVVVAPGAAFNSLAFINLSGTQLDVTVTDGLAGPTVYSKTIDLDGTIIVDWYMYFFEPYDFMSDVVLTDIPPYATGHIDMTLSAGSGTVAIGSLVFGTVYELGSTEMGVSTGIRDYSIKQTDEFGNTTFVQRAYSKRMEPTVFLANTQLNYVSKLLGSLRATPSVWVGSDDAKYGPLVMFGFYRDFSIDIAYPEHSLCRLSIEGLI